MISVIFLKEEHFPEIPNTLISNVFGSESVIDGMKHYHGNSVLVKGKEEDLIKYFSSCGGKIWTSRNPMLGDWEQMTVKKSSK